MASPDPLLNIRLEMLNGKNEEPEEFTKLDEIFNSQGTSEEIKTNVSALRQKFNKFQLEYASHFHRCTRDFEAKKLEIDALNTKQQHLLEDICTARKRIEELQSTITTVQMKTTMGNECLWNEFENANRLQYRTKQELEMKSHLLRDYHIYDANVQARNVYLEDKCTHLLEEQESEWISIESTSTNGETVGEFIEPKPSTSTDKSGMKEDTANKLETKPNATITGNEKELNDLNLKLKEVSNEKMHVDTDNKKIREEKCILQLELDAIEGNLMSTLKKLETTEKELLKVTDALVLLECNKTLDAAKSKEENSTLRTENKNLLVKINKLTKLAQFLDSYYLEKINRMMSSIEGVHDPLVHKLITSHDRTKSESDLMVKQSVVTDKDTTTSNSLTDLYRPITHIGHPNVIQLYSGLTAMRSLLEKWPHSRVAHLTEGNTSEVDPGIQLESATKITELTAECQRLREDIVELKNDKSKLEKVKCSLDNRVEILFNEKEKLIAELDALKSKLNINTQVSREEYDALLSNYSKIEAELSAKIYQPGPSMKATDEFEATTSTEVSAIQDAPADDTVSDIEKPGETETDAVTEIELLKQKLIEIEEELKESKTQGNALLCEKDTLVSMLQESFKNKERVKAQMIQLHNELKTLQAQVLALKEQADTAKDDCATEKANSKQVQSDLRQAHAITETKLRESESDRDNLLGTIAECNRKLQILAEANDALNNSKKRLEEENDTIETENDQLYLENRSIKKILDQERGNSVRIQNEILTTQQRVNELNRLVTQLTSERDQLKSRNDDLAEKINACEERNRDLQGKKDMLELRLQNIDTNLQLSNESYEIKIKRLEDENNLLAADKTLLQTTLEATERKLKIEKKAHLKCLESVEIDKQQLVYQQTVDNSVLEAQNKILSTQIKHLEEVINNDKATVERCKKECNWQRDVVNNQEKRIKKLKAICMEKNQLETELTNKNFAIQDYVNTIKALNSALDDARNSVTEYQNENSDIKSKLDEAEAKLFESITNENNMRELLDETNKKVEEFKSTIIQCLQRLDYIEYTFVQTSSSMAEGDEPNLKDALSTLRAILINVLTYADEPIPTEFGTDISEVFTKLQEKENEVVELKRQIRELHAKYVATTEELNALKSQQELEPEECAECVKLAKRVYELESHIDNLTASGVTDETIESYRNHCDYLTKRIKQLEKDKQKLRANSEQSSESQYTTFLKDELCTLQTKYEKLKTIARMRRTEIHQLKSQLGYDPDQGRSTD